MAALSLIRIKIAVAVSATALALCAVVIAEIDASTNIATAAVTPNNDTGSHDSPLLSSRILTWPIQVLQKSVSNFLQNHNPSKRKLILSAKNRFIGDDVCSTQIAFYELIEPLQFDLGRKVQHVEDFAYSPVVVEYSHSSEVVMDKEKLRQVSLEESPAPRRGWWQWWIPWNDRAKFKSSKYRMENDAFQGGSNGEVFRGRRVCPKMNDETENCIEETLIFKVRQWHCDDYDAFCF
jgi:hypothetical protein